MLKLKSITMKNFMSVGAVTQGINLEENGLTLILGDNIDQGSNGSRNGAGKTVILHAISYGLFGIPMTNIKKDNLINKTNGKNMLVSVEFEKDGHVYKIERGRKPMHFKYIVDNSTINEGSTDEAQGDSRITQVEINKLLGFSALMFKHIVALSTKTIPFLSERAQVQREMIEELLGVTQLSAKAEVLREQTKETRTEIDHEELRIRLVQENNEKTKRTIEQIKLKSSAWELRHRNTIKELENKVEKLKKVDIEKEIEAHKVLENFISLEKDIRNANRILSSEQNVYNSILSQISTLENNRKALLDHKCHACGQEIHDEQHEKMITETEEELMVFCESYNEQEKKYNDAKTRSEQKTREFEGLGHKPVVFYDTIHQTYEHRETLARLIANIKQETDADNPFVGQIEMMQQENIQEINYDLLNEMTKLREHQEFLLKLLTDKNSWVRKQIIEQNLGYLNYRLETYLTKLDLPHQVRFLSDLSVEITKVGQDFDFDNLSTGESTRLVLSLSWAFRDVFESLNFPINIMFIDELVDSGMDSAGAESSLAVLKHIAREMKKNIFLISHKDEFVARVQNVLMVVKENGFTSYQYESDMQV